MQDSSKPIWVNKKELPKLEIEVKPYSIFVATPVHSDVSIHYTQALLEFQKDCFMNKVKTQFQIMKSSLVTQGRNLCVGAFLESKMTHMLFIDSDIDFQSTSIFKMVALDKDVISIPYPLKVIRWDKILENVQSGRFKTVEDLSTGGMTYPMRLPDEKKIKIDNGVIEVTHSPTGCMLIKRSVFEKMIDKYPHLKINQPTVINGELIEKPFLYNFFDTIFDQEKHQYLGEDFAFCKRWKDIGGSCHAYINDIISHIGEYQYCGKFVDELIIDK
jgi:hypothetical protein